MIHYLLRSKVSFEQVKAELAKDPVNHLRKPQFASPRQPQQPNRPGFQQQNPRYPKKPIPGKSATLDEDHKKAFKKVMEDLIGTKGASILDDKLNILGKVPLTELNTTIRSLGNGIHAVAIDGSIDRDLIGTAERSNIQFLIGMEAKGTSARCTIATINDL